MRHLFFTTLLMLASASLSSQAQSLDLPEQAKGEILMVKEISNVTVGSYHSMYISSGENYLKEIELDTDNKPGKDLQNLTGLLNKIKKSGYQLLNTSTRGGSKGLFYMYFIFQKQ